MTDSATQQGGQNAASTNTSDSAAGQAAGAAGGGQAAAPALDVDALSSQIIDKLSAGIASRTAEPPKAPAPADPMADLIRPHVEPGLRASQLAALDAKDAAVFYATTPEAAAFRDKVEGAAQKLMAAGTPFVREDIWKWFLGGNPDVYAKVTKDKSDLAAARAAGATHVGPGSPPKQDAVKQALDMTPEELSKEMEGRTF